MPLLMEVINKQSVIGIEKRFLKKFYLFMAVLGLHCFVWAFSGCGQWGLFFIVVLGLSLWLLLLLQSTGSRHTGSSSCSTQACWLWLEGSSKHALQLWCGAQAQLQCATWYLPGPGIEPMSSALAGGFLATEPLGKFRKEFYSSQAEAHSLGDSLS